MLQCCNLLYIITSASSNCFGCGNSTPCLLWFTAPAKAQKLRTIIWWSPRQKEAERCKLIFAYILYQFAHVFHQSLFSSICMFSHLYLYLFAVVPFTATPSNMCTWLPLPETSKISRMFCAWRRPEDGEIYRSQKAHSDMVYCSLVALEWRCTLMHIESWLLFKACSSAQHSRIELNLRFSVRDPWPMDSKGFLGPQPVSCV